MDPFKNQKSDTEILPQYNSGYNIVCKETEYER